MKNKKIAPNLKADVDKLAEAMNGALSVAQRIQLRSIPAHLKCLEKIIRDKSSEILRAQLTRY